MRRRDLLAGLCAGTAGLLLGRLARAADTVMDRRRFRIAMVLWRGETDAEAGFRRELSALGIQADFEVYDMARNLDQLPAVIAGLRRSKPDLVYAWGTGVTLGLIGRWDAVDPAVHLTDVPVLFTMVSSPRGAGIEPPDGQPPRPNVTGVSHIAPLPAQINAIKAFLPMQRLGVVYNPAETNSLANLSELRALAPTAGFQLLEAPVPAGADGQPDAATIPGLVADLGRRGADILYIGPDNFVGANRDALTGAGIEAGIPGLHRHRARDSRKPGDDRPCQPLRDGRPVRRRQGQAGSCGWQAAVFGSHRDVCSGFPISSDCRWRCDLAAIRRCSLSIMRR